jgi:hypothetical protein
MEAEVDNRDRDDLAHDRDPAQLDQLLHIIEAGGVSEDRDTGRCVRHALLSGGGFSLA